MGDHTKDGRPEITRETKADQRPGGKKTQKPSTRRDNEKLYHKWKNLGVYVYLFTVNYLISMNNF